MTVAAPITDARAALAFMLAGRATLTVRSLRSGAHLTYRVKASKEPGRVTHFVSVKADVGDGVTMAYLGTIGGDRRFFVGRKSELTAASTEAKAFAFVLGSLLRGEMPPQAEIWHEGKCGRCGRQLIVPSSIASGIGPECARLTREAA